MVSEGSGGIELLDANPAVNWQSVGLSAMKEEERGQHEAGETRSRSKEVVRCDRRMEHLHNNISVTVFLTLTFAL